ncbi:anti-sigma regulatory factor [Vibrio vulnificus]|uniref:anti-sigma regulatory factor n=1 Tax=Vibrio vulnificus TaxID=672 RepID=UPI001028E387|nr:anti-sigma regulatory factor [Vibrio vulnificus]EHH2471199.1 anti-sigma regulatory factor [Vibrio vulnificus]EHH3081404.1 anti-sigma regulatory factor [Vibrio vulnificus]EHI9299982.1 anti-sigma regulatory factor [Vibrio vulnificus]EHU5125724.1 anti-sigma regulatory factor [Vibrio vulnificus]EHZ2653458.1 anti-sigma regulatory factor [Vibrio vulnificus]
MVEVVSSLQTYYITSETDVMSAVMGCYNVARELGFDEGRVSEISTSVSELAMNVVKYAEFGRVELSQLTNGKAIGLRVTVRDKGPGIRNIEDALSDHYSTGQSLGLGLPGVKRMMDSFELTTELEKGTTIVAEKWV